MEETKDILKAIEQAQDGYWLPLAAISVLFGVIITLILYIYNRNQKDNDSRHVDTRTMISEMKLTTEGVKETLSAVQSLLAVESAKVDRNTRDIEKLNEEIHEKRGRK